MVCGDDTLNFSRNDTRRAKIPVNYSTCLSQFGPQTLVWLWVRHEKIAWHSSKSGSLLCKFLVQIKFHHIKRSTFLSPFLPRYRYSAHYWGWTYVFFFYNELFNVFSLENKKTIGAECQIKKRNIFVRRGDCGHSISHFEAVWIVHLQKLNSWHHLRHQVSSSVSQKHEMKIPG